MRQYLGVTVRVKKMAITGDLTYNSKHIDEMESISYLWRDGDVGIWKADYHVILLADFQPILNSRTILQCQQLFLFNAHFSFKDYEVLYAVKIIRMFHYVEDEIDELQQYWQQFLEQPRVKPIVFFRFLRSETVKNFLDRLSKAFSSAVSPNAFKILFIQHEEPLTEFRNTNYTSREKLELKKGLPLEHQDERFTGYHTNTLERSNI